MAARACRRARVPVPHEDRRSHALAALARRSAGDGSTASDHRAERLIRNRAAGPRRDRGCARPDGSDHRDSRPGKQPPRTEGGRQAGLPPQLDPTSFERVLSAFVPDRDSYEVLLEQVRHPARRWATRTSGWPTRTRPVRVNRDLRQLQARGPAWRSLRPLVRGISSVRGQWPLLASRQGRSAPLALTGPL